MIVESHLDFLQAFWNRRSLFTYVFLSFNIFLFILMEFAGGTTNEATLMAFGVKSNAEIDQGEVWRLITPIFIHIGLLHLFFNSYALWIVGPLVEKLYGSARFVLLYVLAGVAGVLGSYFYNPNAISAGASGAIFGLFGVLAVFGIKYRHTVPPFFKRAVGTGVVPVILINLVIGFMFPAIDNAAHISGMLAGAFLALLVPFQAPGTETGGRFSTIQAIVIVIIVASFYQVAATYDGPRISFRNLSRSWTQVLGGRSSVQEFIEAVNTTQQAFGNSVQPLETGRVSELDNVQEDITEAIDQLRDIPSLNATADDLTSEMLALMEDQFDLVVNVRRTGTVTLAHSRRLAENTQRYADLMGSFSEWVETEGRRFGIEMRRRR